MVRGTPVGQVVVVVLVVVAVVTVDVVVSVVSDVVVVVGAPESVRFPPHPLVVRSRKAKQVWPGTGFQPRDIACMIRAPQGVVLVYRGLWRATRDWPSGAMLRRKPQVARRVEDAFELEGDGGAGLLGDLVFGGKVEIIAAVF